MDNANFERDQKNFFKKVEESTEYDGQTPEMDKFIEFWGGIWEKEERTTDRESKQCERVQHYRQKPYYSDHKEKKLDCTRS